jgi:palmitoyl-protein thioesterase
MLSKISLLLLSLTFISNIDRYVCQLKYSNNTYPDPYTYPIVLLHGITSDKSELTEVVNWLMAKLPNKVNKVKVYNIEIGNGKMDSIFKTMDWQLNELCYQIYNIPELENGFHFIGMSQGGLLARGYVERCNKFPVQNLITWVSPHAGVYGIGNISGLDINFKNIYTSIYQNIYSFSGYWKDPFRYEQYLSSASYLPYLNNEPNDNNFQKMQNSYYLLDNFYQSIEWEPEKNKANMLSLKNFVMIWSANDDVLSPPESGKFEFYDIVSKQSIQSRQSIQPNELLPIIDLFESEQYTKDLIGLRTLYKSNRLHILETNCTHSGHKTQECFPQLEILTFPFLV